MDLDVTELEALCRELRGRHMSHARLKGVTCSGWWPVVDADGNLTGDVAETGGTLVDWDGGRLTERNGHACEAILK